MRTLHTQDRNRLTKAAMGKIPCDLTLGNLQYFNVFTGEIYPAEVDVLDGIVVRVRENGQKADIPAKDYFDGKGNYLIPGFIDTHMHVESSMMIPENLSRAVVPWGTTTVCTDPHEIGNVMGIDGVKFMLENSKKSTLRQYVLAPSCVPSVPALEGAGARFEAPEIAEILDMPGVVGIAEIMDYVGICQDGQRMHDIVEEGLKRDMYLQGHAPFVTGKELSAYRIGGPFSDHESCNRDEVREKLRCGIHVNLRASSLVDNLAELVAGCRDLPWRDMVSICTDDIHAKDLLTTGHINRVVRQTVEAGIDCREAIKLATFNAAREYKFKDLGAVAPGYVADMQLVENLNGCQPHAVFIAGQLVAQDGVYLGGDEKTETYDLPNTVNIPQITCAEDFLLHVPEGFNGDEITVNVMEAIAPGAHLRKTTPVALPVTQGCVDISSHPELVFVCVANRYGSGDKTIVVYRDFGLETGAMSSTVSHDSHNLTIVYRDCDQALLAAQKLQGCGGGFCVVNQDKATVLALPAGGLMSQEPCQVVAEQIAAFQKEVDLVSGNRLSLMTTAIMCLPVIPGRVITDKGLVDGVTQDFVPVFEV